MGKEIVWRGPISCLHSNPLEQSRCEVGFSQTASVTRGLIRARSAVVCLASEGLVYCWVMVGRPVLWGQVTLIQLQNQACTQLEPMTCWAFLCVLFMPLQPCCQSDGNATCVHSAVQQTLGIAGRCQALGAGGTEGKEVFLPIRLTLPLEAFSDIALSRRVSPQRLPGTQPVPQRHAATWQRTGRPWLDGFRAGFSGRLQQRE